MGVLIFLGGLIGLRLPETLNQKLPSNLAEGELFGKDFSFNDCISCQIDEFAKSETHSTVDNDIESMYLCKEPDKTYRESVKSTQNEFESRRRPRRQTMKYLARQASVMDTQRNKDGAMQLTYWF